MSLLDDWIESAGDITWEEWSAFIADYLEERGLTMSEVNMFVPQHPAMNLAYSNWIRLLPEDTVPRIRRTDGFYAEFSTIIDESYERLESSVEGDLKALVDVREMDQEVPNLGRYR